ncbi:MAG: PilW family protein [Gammaproteobacteria bacterium]|nr:PilW family protein [Gammaproteobacteria bacterium]
MKTLKPKTQQAGFTLIELMIAMVVGLILASGVVTLFVNGQKSFRLNDSIARMQDEARYAMHELSRDMQMAGYLAEPMNPASVIVDPSAITATDCGIAGQPDWIMGMTDQVTGELNMLTAIDDTTGAAVTAAHTCFDAGEILAGSDLVSIKRFAGNSVDSADVINNTIYLRTNGTQGILYMAPLAAAFPVTDNNWEYRPSIYYIRNFADVAGDGIPTLCRKQMTYANAAGSGIETECIARGIENLQIEYGLDNDNDGSANRYVANPTLAEMQTIVSARIFLLARTTVPDFTYVDQKTYSMSNAPDYLPADNFHRRLYTITVPIHNLRNQQHLGLGS